MDDKTNVIRILDKQKIKYKCYNYDNANAYSGTEVAQMINKPFEKVFKTLVLTSKSKRNYVFVVPVEKTLDLKKAAKIVGEKNVEMLPMKELLPLTGYVHGGCSPIGMKKFFRTIIDISAKCFEEIIFSAGKIGMQVEMSLTDLEKVIKVEYSDVTE